MSAILDDLVEAAGQADAEWTRDATDGRPGFEAVAVAAARVIAKRLRERAEEYENRACMSEATMVERSLKAKATALREFADELDPPGGGT